MREQVLDLIDDVMSYTKLFMEYATWRFKRIQGKAFVASLAGRRATAEDWQRYNAQLEAYTEVMGLRAQANALAPHGLTMARLQWLVQVRVAGGSPAIKKKMDDWLEVLQSKEFEAKLEEIAHPFK